MNALRTIDQIHDAFDAGATTAEKLVTERLLLAHSHGRDPTLAHEMSMNSVITVCAERALAQARRADATIQANRGKVPRQEFPLLGIPAGIKDNLVIEGVRTTCASRVLENYIPPYTATCVQRLEAAGAITIAKLNLDEFAMGGSNEYSAYGAVKNPHDPERVAGGSSGGSAAAVASELCAFSLGSDTGGSVRLPASYCGVVGFKPTYGRVSRYGLVAFASTLDQVGPLANSVQDATRIFTAMSGHDPRDSTSLPVTGLPASKDHFSQSLKGLKLGQFRIPEGISAQGISLEVAERLEAATNWFRSQGAEIQSVELPHTSYVIDVYYLIAMAEASANLERFDGVRYGNRPPQAEQATQLVDFYKKVRAQFGPEVKRRILLGTFALSAGYADDYYRRACQVRRLIDEDFQKAFAQIDFILSPVAPTSAFKLGEKSRNPLEMYLNDLFTIPANLCGLPAISVPTPGVGLPMGIQLTGPRMRDESLLALAQAYQEGQE